MSAVLELPRSERAVLPVRPPLLTRAVEALLCWFSAEPLSASGRYLLKHTTRTVKARFTAVNYRMDIHTLGREPAAGSIGLNDIVQASLSLNQPIFCDAYADDRSTGSFVLIDELTNQTVAAGMIG